MKRVKRNPQISTPQRRSLSTLAPAASTSPAAAVAEPTLFGNPSTSIRRKSNALHAPNSPATSTASPLTIPRLGTHTATVAQAAIPDTTADPPKLKDQPQKAPWVPSRSIADDRAYIAVLKSDILLVQKKVDDLLGKKDRLGTSTIERTLSRYNYVDDPKTNLDSKLCLMELRDRKMIQLEMLTNSSTAAGLDTTSALNSSRGASSSGTTSVSGLQVSALSRLPSFIALLDHYIEVVNAHKNCKTNTTNHNLNQLTQQQHNQTEDDLVKLQDLPAELNSQNGRHNSICSSSSILSSEDADRLRSLEANNIKLSKALQESKAKCDQLTTELEELRQKLKKCEQDKEAEIQKAKSASNAALNASTSNTSRRDANQLKQLQQKVSSLECKINDGVVAKQILQKKFQDDIGGLKDEIDHLKQTNDDLKSKLKLSNDKCKDAEDARKLSSLVSEWKQKYEDLAKSTEALQDTNSVDLSNLRNDLKQMKLQLTAALSDLQKSNTQYSTVCNEYKEDKSEWQAKQESLQTKLTDKQTLVNELQMKIAQYQRQVTKMEQEALKHQTALAAASQEKESCSSPTRRPRGIARSTQTAELGHWLCNEDWDDYKMMRNVYYHSIMMHQTTITELKKLIA
eukprot:TRINITY_DN58684_c0_g1_i1.p1 TRINITY_DN58684_c0_g1~~TRINITY_DN58684_c0_g1_i1.p1  ORF type:complete len:627 (-),score=56.14 TRINITY_DN58684_c0_g1_i1:53-1933(-)